MCVDGVLSNVTAKPNKSYETAGHFEHLKHLPSFLGGAQVAGKEKCHAKNYDEQLSQWEAKIYTQHVPLRQNAEEKVREMGLKAVDDSNE